MAGYLSFHLSPAWCAMDYNLAALKLMCRQLKEAKQTTIVESSSQSTSFSLCGILFQRAWVQGVLVSSYAHDDSRFLLDDGTGVVELLIQLDVHKRDWKPGMYVMVVGGYCIREGEIPLIKVHKIVDLSTHPDREAMWYLEVIEAYKMFYLPFFDEFD